MCHHSCWYLSPRVHVTSHPCTSLFLLITSPPLCHCETPMCDAYTKIKWLLNPPHLAGDFITILSWIPWWILRKKVLYDSCHRNHQDGIRRAQLKNPDAKPHLKTDQGRVQPHDPGREIMDFHRFPSKPCLMTEGQDLMYCSCYITSRNLDLSYSLRV